MGAGGASPWPTRVRQRRPGRSRWPLVAHAVLGRRHSQRRPHPSRVAGATRLAWGGYGGDTRTLLDRLELMAYSKGHQRPPKATRCVLKCGGPFPYSLAGTWVHNKSFKTVTGMSELLVRDRGLVCSDIDELKRFLSRVNYYRFSGYAREFQRDPKCGNNDFITGSSFQTIVGLMQADSKLRHLLLEQLGVIEMAIRARLAHECGRVYGSSAYYLDVGRYSCHKKGSNQGAINPTNIVKGILSDLERDKSRMVEHYIDSSVAGNDLKSRCQRYRNVPIWVAVEVLSFGRKIPSCRKLVFPKLASILSCCLFHSSLCMAAKWGGTLLDRAPLPPSPGGWKVG